MIKVYLDVPQQAELPGYCDGFYGPLRAFVELNRKTGALGVAHSSGEPSGRDSFFFKMSPYARGDALRAFLEGQLFAAQRLLDEPTPEALEDFRVAVEKFSGNTRNLRQVRAISCEEAIRGDETWKDGETLREAAERHIAHMRAKNIVLCDPYCSQAETSEYIIEHMERALLNAAVVMTYWRTPTDEQIAALRAHRFDYLRANGEDEWRKVTCADVVAEMGSDVWIYGGKTEYLLENATRAVYEYAADGEISLMDTENLPEAIIEGTWRWLEERGSAALRDLPVGVVRLLEKKDADRMAELRVESEEGMYC